MGKNILQLFTDVEEKKLIFTKPQGSKVDTLCTTFTDTGVHYHFRVYHNWKTTW